MISLQERANLISYELQYKMGDKKFNILTDTCFEDDDISVGIIKISHSNIYDSQKIKDIVKKYEDKHTLILLQLN